SVHFGAVAHDAAPAVLADRRHLGDRALEAVEDVHRPLAVNLEGHVVVVATYFAGRHGPPPSTGSPVGNTRPIQGEHRLRGLPARPWPRTSPRRRPPSCS